MLSACMNLETVHSTSSIGSNSRAREMNGLEVAIRPDSDTVVYGNPITFHLSVRNVSNHSMYLPRNPEIVFCWVYPSGQRDNHLLDITPEHHYTHSALIPIRPGQVIQYSKRIETDFFPKRGITEFVAFFHGPKNTNPDIFKVWSGEAESNRYGILVEKPSRIAKYKAAEMSLQPGAEQSM